MTGSGVMTIFVYKGLTRNRKSEISPSESFSISGEWDKLKILYLAPMFLIKRY